MKTRKPTGAQLTKELERFKFFIVERGVELLTETNPWELVRFKTGKGVQLIYKSKDEGALCSFVGDDAWTAWVAFRTGSNWRAIPATKRKTHQSVDYRTVIERDGPDCFFCAELVPEGTGTIEHLVTLSHNGPRHISNMFLAHKDCNNRAGNLSAPQKILMYHKARLEKLLRRIDEQGRRDRRASDPDLTEESHF